MHQHADDLTAPSREGRTNTEHADRLNFLKELERTYHLLIVTSQQSGMTCGKSARHVSPPLLTTQVTHPAISDEGYSALALHP